MNINAIDLRQLRYFVTVAEELHFGRAARRLNMSQPPLSQQIMALEHFLGTALFWRTNRHVELTPAGHYLLPEAKRLLREVAQVAEGVKHAEAGLAGRIRIGVNFSAPLHPKTATLLQKFRTCFSGTQVELVLHERSNVLQLVDFVAADLDLALIWLDYGFEKPDIFRIDLAHDALQVVLPQEHPLAEKARVNIRDLIDVPIISTPRHSGTQLYEGVMHAFAAINEQPRIMYEALQMPLIMSMVAAGQGIALLPAFLEKIPIAGVVFRPLTIPRGKAPFMTYNLVGLTTQRNAAAQNFINTARKLVI